jgi:hypothetical protein
VVGLEPELFYKYCFRGENFEEELDFKLSNMFSSPNFRQINSILNNPSELGSITAIVDG